MKYWQFPIYAVLGFIVILLALPTSRWVVLKQLDVLTGKWRSSGYPTPLNLRPVYPEIEKPAPSADETGHLLYLVNLAPLDPNPQETQSFIDLYNVCRAKNDPKYLAMFARHAGWQAYIRIEWPNRPISKERFGGNREIQIRLRDTCLEGQKLDPTNSFFPGILSGVLYQLGDLKGSRSALLMAASDSKYDDYEMFEVEMRNAYIVSRYGDRGNQSRAISYSQNLSMQGICLSSVGIFYCEDKDIEGRFAVMKLASLILGQCSTDYMVYEAKDLIEWAIQSKANYKMHGPELDPKLLSLCKKQMEAEPHSREVIDRATKLFDSVPNVYQHGPDSKNPYALIDNPQSAYSAWSILGLLLIPLGLGLVAFKIRDPQLSAASPYLAWIMTFVVGLTFERFNVWMLAYTLPACLFVPALFPKYRKVADCLGGLVVVTVFYEAPWHHSLLTPVAIFAGGLIIERKFKEIPTWISAMFLIAACAIGAECWVGTALREGALWGIILGLLATIAACAAIPIRPPIRWLPLAGASCLVLGVLFGAMVEKELALDRQLAVVCDSLLHGAAELRRQ